MRFFAPDLEVNGGLRWRLPLGQPVRTVAFDRHGKQLLDTDRSEDRKDVEAQHRFVRRIRGLGTVGARELCSRLREV